MNEPQVNACGYPQGETKGDIMDLSGIIVIVFGVLFFFGGVAWLEIRSRKNSRSAQLGEHLPQPDAPAMSGERTVRGHEMESG